MIFFVEALFWEELRVKEYFAFIALIGLSTKGSFNDKFFFVENEFMLFILFASPNKKLFLLNLLFFDFKKLSLEPILFLKKYNSIFYPLSYYIYLFVYIKFILNII